MNCTTLFLATLRSDTGKENAINGSVSSVCLQNVLVTPDRQRTLEWLDTTDVLPESSGLFATHRGGYIKTSTSLRVLLSCVGIDSRWPSYAMPKHVSVDCERCSGGGWIWCDSCCLEYGREQLEYMDAQMQWSTYGKVRIDIPHSKVRSVDIESSGLDSEAACFETGRALAGKAASILESTPGWRWKDIDVPYWFLPDSLMVEKCGVTLGECYIGMFHVTRPSPYYQSDFWKTGCMTYNEPLNHGTTRVHLHEIGHFLGLGHSSGKDQERTRCTQGHSCLTAYGDASSVMGNDGAVPNALTSIARYDFGALPGNSIATSINGAQCIRLTQLSAGPPTYGSGWHLAAALRCHSCRHRSEEDIIESPTGGGDLWITLRGGSVFSPPWSLESDIPHFADHSERHDRVVIDYRPSTAPNDPLSTQQWYWMKEGDTFAASDRGPCFHISYIRKGTLESPSAAHVGIADTCTAAKEASKRLHCGVERSWRSRWMLRYMIGSCLLLVILFGIYCAYWGAFPYVNNGRSMRLPLVALDPSQSPTPDFLKTLRTHVKEDGELVLHLLPN